MLFGLSNALATFQGYVNKILAEKLDVFIMVYLNDILIYIEDPGQAHVKAVWWVLENLKKYGLFANLKKCRFHQDEVCFLCYVMSALGVQMEDEKIKAIKSWPEPNLVQDIQVFIGFANFYWRFIQGFSKVAAPLTSILKTGLTANTLSQKLRVDQALNEKLSKSKNPAFLTANARQAFIQLRQGFTEAPILSHFDPERHIRIETDTSGYAIGSVLSQLTSDSGQ